MSGVSYKDNGKIDVINSIDFFHKSPSDFDKRTNLKLFSKRRDSGISTQSMMRLQSYRSIQHEPSNKEKSCNINKSNYSALKSQIDRFSSPKLDFAELSGATFKRNNSEEKLEQNEEIDQLEKTENFEEKSQFYGKLKTDYDETIYNVLTMKEKGFIKDDLPIRTG